MKVVKTEYQEITDAINPSNKEEKLTLEAEVTIDEKQEDVRVYIKVFEPGKDNSRGNFDVHTHPDLNQIDRKIWIEEEKLKFLKKIRKELADKLK